MDAMIEQAVESAYRIEREYGYVCERQSRMIATMTAIRRLAETNDASVILGCPEWLLSELNEWVAHFRKTGNFGFFSSVGDVDHSSIMAEAVSVLDRGRDA